MAYKTSGIIQHGRNQVTAAKLAIQQAKLSDSTYVSAGLALETAEDHLRSAERALASAWNHQVVTEAQAERR